VFKNISYPTQILPISILLIRLYWHQYRYRYQYRCTSNQDIWATSIEAVLCCERERFNPSEPYFVCYAVAMLHDGAVIGHVPHIISAVCSAFLRRGSVIESEVTVVRQYSANLPQSGMEVPCKLIFTVPLRRRYCR